MSSRWTAQWGQAVSYNCMSVLQTHRRRDICKFYGQSAVICLQGTRVRQDRDIPLKSFLESNFYCISFGYSSRSNKHAGVDIMLSNKFFKQEDIRMISWPEEPELAGRALHVRTADATRDHSWICAYIPPNSISLAKKVYGWLRKLYRSIAGRTFAVLCIDANGHVGLGQSSASIGAESPEKEDALGGLFKLFLEDFGLCALNTFHECVPSFHSGRDNCRGTRPDYIVIPFTRFVNEGYLARTVCVDQTGGDALQLVRTVKRVDHSPVVAKVLLKSLQYSGGAFSMNAKFDLHKLSRCLLLGENRQVFFDSAKDIFESVKDTWNEYRMRVSPTSLFHVYTIAIQQAASIFKPSKSQQHIEYKKRIDHILEQRRQLRKDIDIQEPHQFTLALNVAHVLRRHGQLQNDQFFFAARQVVKQWMVTTKLQKLSKALQSIAKQHKVEIRDQLISEIQHARKARNAALEQQLCRQLAVVKKGTRRKWKSMPKTSRFTHEEACAFFKKPGNEGGWSASKIEIPNFLKDLHECNVESIDLPTYARQLFANDPELLPVGETQPRELLTLAVEVVQNMKNDIWRFNTRKSVPIYDLPAAIWRIIFHPQWRRSKPRLGVGHAEHKKSGFVFPAFMLHWIQDTIMAIYHTKRLPQQTLVNIGHAVPKRIMSVLEEEQIGKDTRIVHAYGVFSGLFSRSLFFHRLELDKSLQVHRNCFGGIPGRSRIHAIATQEIVANRLRQAKILHSNTSYDISKAFPSVEHSSVDEILFDSVPDRDTNAEVALLRSMLFENFCLVFTVEGYIALLPHEGISQGHVLACHIFNAVYSISFNEYNEATRDDNLVAVHPSTDESIDVGSTVFIDDLETKSTSDSIHGMAIQTNRKPAVYDRFFMKHGFVQNVEKREITFWISGQFSNTFHRSIRVSHASRTCKQLVDTFEVEQSDRLELYRAVQSLQKSMRDTMRYLGPYLDPEGIYDAEVEKRIAASTTIYYQYYGLYKQKLFFNIKKMFFMSTFLSTLTSGLDALALKSRQWNKIDAHFMKFLRKTMCGRATEKHENDDGVTIFKGISNKELLLRTRLVPPSTFTRCLRIKNMQKVFGNGEHHEVFLASFFGYMKFETEFIPHRWYVQFQNDLLHFNEFDTTVSVSQPLARNPHLLFTDPELQTDFIFMNTDILKATFFTTAIPPPGTHMPIQYDIADSAVKFECSHTGCDATFVHFRDLCRHEVQAHKSYLPYRALAVSNICPFCMTVFRSIATAKNHVMRSFIHGKCSADQAIKPTELKEISNVNCVFCDEQFHEIYQYCWHIRKHIYPAEIEFPTDPLPLISLPRKHGGHRSRLDWSSSGQLAATGRARREATEAPPRTHDDKVAGRRRHCEHPAESYGPSESTRHTHQSSQEHHVTLRNPGRERSIVRCHQERNEELVGSQRSFGQEWQEQERARETHWRSPHVSSERTHQDSQENHRRESSEREHRRHEERVRQETGGYSDVEFSHQSERKACSDQRGNPVFQTGELLREKQTAVGDSCARQHVELEHVEANASASTNASQGSIGTGLHGSSWQSDQETGGAARQDAAVSYVCPVVEVATGAMGGGVHVSPPQIGDDVYFIEDEKKIRGKLLSITANKQCRVSTEDSIVNVHVDCLCTIPFDVEVTAQVIKPRTARRLGTSSTFDGRQKSRDEVDFEQKLKSYSIDHKACIQSVVDSCSYVQLRGICKFLSLRQHYPHGAKLRMADTVAMYLREEKSIQHAGIDKEIERLKTLI